jgi:hypothetical protein
MRCLHGLGPATIGYIKFKYKRIYFIFLAGVPHLIDREK